MVFNTDPDRTTVFDEYTTGGQPATHYMYNSLGEAEGNKSPDANTSEFLYDKLGRIRFSRNANQTDEDKYSYIKYDPLGRVIEAGQSYESSWTSLDPEAESFPENNIDQMTLTVYSEPSDDLPFGEQEYLLNRVSYTETHNKITPNDTEEEIARTYYSYDPHGNVKKIIRKVPGLPLMYTEYEYDLISGNVKKVMFNNGLKAPFYHKYDYDGDNRLLAAYTSDDNVIWDKDAAYNYYLHGPLSSAELGEDHIQKTDYAYTAQGWLKAINNPFDDDEGGDFEDDKFAMMLEYFNGDFTNPNSPFDADNESPLHGTDLYNGNISTWISRTGHIGSGLFDNQITGYLYRYDKLNRIKNGDFYNFDKTSGYIQANPDQYKVSYSYDPNGNLDVLTRLNGTGQDMDELHYAYNERTNQLNHVNDFGATPGTFDFDIDDQEPDNYLYDEIGNLIRDKQEQINIKWNLQGKISEVIPDFINDPAKQKPYLKFLYDTEGNRIEKIVYQSPKEEDYDVNGNITSYGIPENLSVQYYLRDASGNIMSIYKRKITKNKDDYTAEFTVEEQAVYGSDRLGIYKPNDIISEINFSNLDELANINLNLLPDASVTSEYINWVSPLASELIPGIYRLNGYKYSETVGYTKDDEIFNGDLNEFEQNITVAENLIGELKLSSFTAVDENGNPIFKMFDSEGNEIPYEGTVYSDYTKRSHSFKMPGTGGTYAVLTTEKDKLYYHTVDFENANTVSINNPADPATDYTGHFAVVEDMYNDKAYIYAVSGVFINKLIFENGAYSQTETLTKVPAEEIVDVELSGDGQKLALLCNEKDDAKITVYNTQGEEPVSWDIAGSSALTKGQVEFGEDPNYIYYSFIETGGKERTGRLNIVTGYEDGLGNEYGDLKRGKDNLIYWAHEEKGKIYAYNGTTSVGEMIAADDNYKFTGVLPSQSVKYYKPNPDEIIAYREVDNKHYELKDHLGNVRVTLSDRKGAFMGMTDIINFAVIRAANNYYPFGMLQPERFANTEDYRYGFQGQEMDNEIKGVGNSINYKFRIHDPRLGRFLSIDPLTAKYPFYSPYAFSGNRVIDMVELEGLEPKEPESPGTTEGESRTTYGSETSYKPGFDGTINIPYTTHSSQTWYYYTGQEGSGIEPGWKTETYYANMLVKQAKGESIFNPDASNEQFAGMLHNVEVSVQIAFERRRAYMASGLAIPTNTEFDVVELLSGAGLLHLAGRKLFRKAGVELLEEGLEKWSRNALKQSDYLVYMGYKESKLYIGKTFDSLSKRYTKTVIKKMDARVIEKLTKIPNNGTVKGVEYWIFKLNGGKPVLANKYNPANNIFYRNAGKNWLNKNVPNWEKLFKFTNE